MKNFYIIITILLSLTIWSCKTKQSVTETKEETKTETEVLITENSNQTSLVTEKEEKRETKQEVDKSFLEAWLQIKSDVAVLEDTHGNKWTFTSPELMQKQTQSNDITKNEQTDTRSDKVTEIEENQQRNTDVRMSKETNTDVSEKHTSKGKEPVWLWIVGGCVVGGLGYFVLKRLKLV